MKQSLILIALSVSPVGSAQAETSLDLCSLPTMTREKYPPYCLVSYDTRIFTMLRSAVAQQRDCFFDAKGTLRSQAEADRCLAVITNTHCSPQVSLSLRELESCQVSPARSGS